jgi:hypothetical protein
MSPELQEAETLTSQLAALRYNNQTRCNEHHKITSSVAARMFRWVCWAVRGESSCFILQMARTELDLVLKFEHSAHNANLYWAAYKNGRTTRQDVCSAVETFWKQCLHSRDEFVSRTTTQKFAVWPPSNITGTWTVQTQGGSQRVRISFGVLSLWYRVLCLWLQCRPSSQNHPKTELKDGSS